MKSASPPGASYQGKSAGDRGMTYHLTNRKGVALLMVLWIMVLLMVIVFEFSYIARSDIDMVANFKDSVRAYYLSLAGIDAAIREIIRPSAFQYIDEEGQLAFGQTVSTEEGEATVTGQSDQFERTDAVLGSGRFSYYLIDEDSKININTATREVFARLLSQLGIDMGVEQDEIIDAIFDWRDRDQEHRMNGAEDDYYNSLPVPYDCKDGKFDSVNELLLVKGITPELFYGPEVYGEPSSLLTESPLGLRDLLTTYGHQINKNTAPDEVLYATLPESDAYRIISDREQFPRHGREGQSRYFTVISQGIIDASGIVHTIRATISKLGATVRINYWKDNYIDLHDMRRTWSSE
jgi:general secretion pathway protein K